MKRRMKLIVYKDPEAQAKVDNFKKNYMKLKVLKYIAVSLYLLLPFFEKPPWCINNTELD